jgi:hypothetical protein
MDFYQSFFGRNPSLRCRAGAIGTTELNIYPVAQAIKWAAVFDAAYALDFSSSSASDAAAGTGARTVEIYGLDKDWNPQQETITLNGQTKGTGTATWRRVFGAFVQTTGSGGVNAGDIYLYKTGTGGTITAGVPGTLTGVAVKCLVGDNLGFSGIFTSPAGRRYSLSDLTVSGRAQAGTLILKHGKPTATTGIGPFNELKLEFGAGSLSDLVIGGDLSPLVIGEKEDVYFTAICAAASGIVNVFAKFAQINN